jgi:hypothetical protein
METTMQESGDERNMQTDEYQVLGGYYFYYTAQSVTGGGNKEFIYSDEDYEGFKVCLQKGGLDYTLTLTEEQGVCCSGWTTASWGHWELDQESTTHLISMVPIRDGITLKLNKEQSAQRDIDCELFFVSYNGSSVYYPDGSWELKESQWIEKTSIQKKDSKPNGTQH